MIHGEHQVSYTSRPLLVGEEIHCYTKLEDYYEKESRGSLLGFMVMERFGDSAGGERSFTMRDVIVGSPALRKVLGA